MSYRDFTLGSALENLHITWIDRAEEPQVYETLSQEFSHEREFLPSDTFKDEFIFGIEVYRRIAVHSEGMVKSYLMRPFLWEVWKQHRGLHLWEGMPLNADPGQNLTGEPDYMVTKKEKIPKSPYCVIVEAKKDDFEQGWGQALAAMRGGQILNRRESSAEVPVYGVVSTGVAWQFGKLLGDQFIMLPETFVNIFEKDRPVKVLTLLDIIFCECEKHVRKIT